MGLAKIWKVEVPSKNGEYWVVLPQAVDNVAEACYEKLCEVLPEKMGDRGEFLDEVRLEWGRNCWAADARVMRREEVGVMESLPGMDKVVLPPFGSLLK